MKKALIALLLTTLFLIPNTSFALGGGVNTPNDSCATKYPIILAHGMAASAEILGIVDYWWGIRDALEAQGAKVYITSVNGMDSTENKAIAFKEQFLAILAESGAEKANIIGHSHGTVYTRYAISNLDIGKYVASHTSLCGPHQGSSIANVFADGLPANLGNFTSKALDFIYTWVFGDTNPNTNQNMVDLTTSYMKNTFNPNTPNHANIYYQSWAAKVKIACPSVILQPSWLMMLALEGSNDGLVSVESAKWGNFRGVESGAIWSPGVDHLNMVGMFFGATPGFSAPEFFVDLLADLKGQGF